MSKLFLCTGAATLSASSFTIAASPFFFLCAFLFFIAFIIFSFFASRLGSISKSHNGDLNFKHCHLSMLKRKVVKQQNRADFDPHVLPFSVLVCT